MENITKSGGSRKGVFLILISVGKLLWGLAPIMEFVRFFLGSFLQKVFWIELPKSWTIRWLQRGLSGHNSLSAWMAGSTEWSAKTHKWCLIGVEFEKDVRDSRFFFIVWMFMKGESIPMIFAMKSTKNIYLVLMVSGVLIQQGNSSEWWGQQMMMENGSCRWWWATMADSNSEWQQKTTTDMKTLHKPYLISHMHPSANQWYLPRGTLSYQQSYNSTVEDISELEKCHVKMSIPSLLPPIASTINRKDPKEEHHHSSIVRDWNQHFSHFILLYFKKHWQAFKLKILSNCLKID